VSGNITVRCVFLNDEVMWWIRMKSKPILVNKQSEFEALLRGPSLRTMSSRDLDWKSFLLEQHRREPQDELPESVSERYILGLWTGNDLGDHRNGSRGVHAVTTGVHDPVLRQLITLLAHATKQGGPSGLLYAEHLAHALAIRLFFRATTETTQSRAARSALSPHLLRRVRDRMHNLNSDLDLQTLAKETGCSRSHFLRMFRTATGYAPHQYVLRVRLKRAQELMRLGSMSLIDVAAHCGFSSHAHMSGVFRQLLVVPPSEYRRNL
jgi:AraC family transcriptional regulator